MNITEKNRLSNRHVTGIKLLFLTFLKREGHQFCSNRKLHSQRVQLGWNLLTERKSKKLAQRLVTDF